MKTMDDCRLIEDYLPLDALNAIASGEVATGEKLNPRRYVELVHYWPARRPITASRAAIYAALVPVPDSDDERQGRRPSSPGSPRSNPIRESSRRPAFASGGRMAGSDGVCCAPRRSIAIFRGRNR